MNDGKQHLQRITSHDDITAGLQQLLQVDPSLVPVSLKAGPLPLRLHQPGFAGLARIVSAQLVSRASAEAIYARFAERVPGQSPGAWLATDEDCRREIGLTRAKQRALDAIAQSMVSGNLDLDALSGRPSREAIGELVRFTGIGPWTAEIYLLFCCGHADVFPAGDLALRIAVSRALELEGRVSQEELRQIAGRWKPLRGIAARLFWAYYSTIRGKR